MKFRKWGLLLAIIMMGHTAFALQEAGEEEITVSGFHTSSVGSDDTITNGTIFVELAHYWKQNIRLGGSVSTSITTSDGDTSNSNTLGGSADYFFLKPDQEWIPFVGGEFALATFSESDESSLVIAPKVGIKRHYTRELSFGITSRYQILLSELDDDTSAVLFTTIGFSYLFDI